MARDGVSGLLTVLSALLALSGCDDGAREDAKEVKSKEKEAKSKEKEKVPKEPIDYISKTPNAKIYPHPPKDPNIEMIFLEGKIAFRDNKTGDLMITQTADFERNIKYFAYVTKDREMVRIFMMQWGGGYYGRPWRVYPVRLWHVEEAKIITPAVKAAQKRATKERLAQFLASVSRFKDRKTTFMLIDAPVSEVDPL